MEGIKSLVKRHFVSVCLPLLLFGHFLVLSNIKFTAWPEMLNWPYLMANGFMPYRDIAIAHNPLLLFALALFYKLGGVSVWGLMTFTWMVILLTDILLFYVIERMLNPRVAVIGLTFFVLWQTLYQGNGMWFDLFMTPFILASYYFIQNKKYLLAGLFWAFAFLTKQTAVWFLIPIICTIYTFKGRTLQGSEWKTNTKQFLIGNCFVFLPFILLLIAYSLVADYLFWAVKFGIFILPRAIGQVSLPTVRQAVIYLFPFIPLLYLLLTKKTKPKLLLVWTISGMLSVYPRFEVFHFQPALPFLAIAFSLLLADVLEGGLKSFKKLFFGYVILSVILVGGFVIKNFSGDIRFLDSKTIETADYIKKITHTSEKTYFLNIWENSYFLTGTLPAIRPFVPHLSWYMELPNIQDEIVEDLKRESPNTIFVGEFSGGELATYVPMEVYGYITSEYQVINVVNGITVYQK